MAKLPEPPPIDRLRANTPAIYTLAAGSTLARIYFAAGPFPRQWNEWRNYGPTNARFDHHLPDANGEAQTQQRAVLYAATSALTCIAEVFQQTRRVDRVRNAPHLAVFQTTKDLQLLDLTGAFTTRIGASTAINSGPSARARRWAQAFYTAYPQLHGLRYSSSMNGHEPAIALTERALDLNVLPELPDFDRALGDDSLLDILKSAADAVGYALR